VKNIYEKLLPINEKYGKISNAPAKKYKLRKGGIYYGSKGSD
jgi:hypothetical protein